MFASRSVSLHLLRGIGGFTALGLVIPTAQFIWPVFLLIPFGLFLLRGCPMCWTMGLIETIGRSFQKQTPASSNTFCQQCNIKTERTKEVYGTIIKAKNLQVGGRDTLQPSP